MFFLVLVRRELFMPERLLGRNRPQLSSPRISLRSSQKVDEFPHKTDGAEEIEGNRGTPGIALVPLRDDFKCEGQNRDLPIQQY